MPIIELKSRGVELDFPDSMSDQEIQDAINKEYPRDGKDVAYELEQFRNAALTGGDLSNPFDQMSNDDYIKLRQYQDKEKKSWSDLFGIAKDTFSTIYDDVIQGAGSSIYNAATGKAGQVAESAKQGMIAGTIGMSDLATKIVDPSKPIPAKEDFLKQTKDQPLETMADEAAPFFRKQVKNTEEDYLAFVKNEKRKDSESFNRILAMESTLRGAPIEDVAAAFQYVDPTLLAGVASAGVKTLAKTLLKKGAQETAQASVEAAAREAAQRAAQQSAETIEGGGMREVVFNQAENLAQGVQSAASLPGKVMQAVKEGAEAIAPGTGAPAQAAAMTAAAMTDLGITASVLAGTKTIEKAAEVAGSIVRAAKQGASRAGLLERAALDPKISGSARAFANGLAQIQPLFGVGVRTAKQAAKGALAGAGVGAGLGYLADGEEGAAAGLGAGAAFGSMFGTLGSLWDVSKEAIGGSTARTRQNAAGDIGRFIAEKPPQEQAGWTSVFNNLAAKSGLEKAAHSMDALKIAEAAGAEVRLATPDEIAKWNNPGWTNHNEISGKQELVLNPKRILSDTAPHETAHIHFNAATNNLFKPEMFKAIVGSVDPVDGRVISEGLFNNEGLARIADDIAKAYGKANESQKNLFSNYADQLRNSLEPENLAKAREAIVDELTATYVGKAFNRSKAGRFNPDRLPLLYRRALDSIHEGFFNKLRATIYEKGNVLNMRDISKAFIDDKGRPIRIPELDAIFKKAFTNKLKAVDENTAPVDRIPVNLNDRAIWARSYGNMSGVLNPDNTVKSAAQIDREAAQRWQDMTARLSALPENQRLGLSFGRDDKGKTTMTAKGQISEEAINAILASDSIDQTAKSFLREVFTSIKDPQKTTLDTRYYGVYTRGKGTNKMVAGVKPASQNEILPYSIEFNSKDGIIVRAVDMTKVRDRLADALRKPDFKDAYKDYNQAMRAFRTYLDNLTLDKPVESSIILGGGELGNKRRNLFYDALDFRPAQGDEIRNNPLKLATGKSNPIKSYRIERFTSLSPTRDKFAFEEGTTYTRVKSNYQPDSFTPETLPNGEAWTNPDGYRILKKTGSKLYRVYDKDGTEIGVTSSQDAAIKKINERFISETVKQRKLNDGIIDTERNNVIPIKGERDVVVLTPESLKRFQPSEGINLEDYKGRTMIALPADRMGIGTLIVGPKGKERTATVVGQGGAGFPSLQKNSAWAFSTESAAKSLLKRARDVAKPGEKTIILGITSMSPVNHIKNQTGQRAYVDALKAAIDSKLVSQKDINIFIQDTMSSILTRGSLKEKIREKLKHIKSFSDFEKAVEKKSLNFSEMAEILPKLQLKRPKSAFSLNEQKQLGVSLDDVAKQTADERYYNSQFGDVVALVELDLNQTPSKTGFHYSYPFELSGKEIGFLRDQISVSDLTSERRIYQDNRLSAQPLQTVLPELDLVNSYEPKSKAYNSPENVRFQPITPEQDAAIKKAQDSFLKSEKKAENDLFTRIRFQYAGESAELPQFMRDSLETAKAMAKEGKDSEAIRAITGWFPGKYDDKMRWEVPSQEARYLPATKQRNKGAEQWTANLEEIIDHPALFKAYPESRQIRVSRLSDSGSASGAFSPESNSIVLNALKGNMENFSTLLHEIQHWIQEKEGFETGSNPKQFEKYDMEALKAENAKYATAMRKLISQYKANGKTFSDAMQSDHGKILSESLNKIQDALKEPERKYRLSAGEIEARDIQARQSFTPEQRKAIAPYSSENIAKDEAIVLKKAENVRFQPDEPATTKTRFQQITPEQDAAYLNAVKSGDSETAQAMVDDAAFENGLEEWFHGNTKSFGGFSSTDLGVHFGTEDAAKDRLDQTGQISGVVNKYYVDIKNPVKLKYDPDTWQALDVWQALPKDIKDKVENSYEYVIQDLELGELKKELQKLGFDGIKYRNAFEGVGDSILVFDKEQIKSADPVTYDGAGNVIPLSQRFNPSSNDIRFQPDPSMPSVLNGSNGTRIIKSNSGKFRVYSVTGALLGIRDTQQAAEKLAAKP